MKFKKLIMAAVLSTSAMFLSQANAVDMNDASWYLNVDVNALKSGPLLSLIDHNDGDFKKVTNLLLGQEFHDQIDQVTLYGDKEGFDNFSVLIQGDFSESAKQGFLNHPNIELNEETLYFKKQKIQKWKLNSETQFLGLAEEIKVDNQSEVELYVTEINPQLIMVSKDLSDTQSWLSNNHSIKEISQNGLFSVIVNLQEALAHGGMKFDDENKSMHSEILKKVSQVSFSVIEDHDEYLFEAALSTEDEAAAIQIEQVLNGLVALNALSNTNMNELLKQFMANLKLEKDGINIIISSSAGTELILQTIAEKN